MVVFVCSHITLLHYHHYAEVSESIQILSGNCQVHSVECVSRISQFSQLSFMQYMGAVCIPLTRVQYDDCKNTCALS